jgi:succinate-semialdehyde dehydrogenase/glutarate-semialdehyde dehydrogenase
VQRSIDPTTGAVLAELDSHDPARVDELLSTAVAAQPRWRETPIEERVPHLTAIAKALRADAESLARLITAEMGKPVAEARGEIEKCAVTLDYYAEHAAAHLADAPIASSAADSRVVYDPLGVVLAVMPWNYPFWQFFRFAAPALAAGNAAVLKHASNVPQSAVRMEELCREAGLPEGLVTTLLVDSGSVASIIDDDRIAAVTLTGSTEVGSIVAGQAGRALKKQVLELGGSDPYIVLPDADVEQAARTAVRARVTNNGQSCVNAKRFIVHSDVADEFVATFVEAVQALVVGDPSDDATQIGPMAREGLRSTLHDQVERTLAAGGTLLTGGHVIDGEGWFYAPTVIDHVDRSQVAFTEETFGPVAAITRVDSVDEAVAIANDTEFGLGAAVWSRDLELAERVARRIDAGAVFVNSMVASDPRLPFGGIKRSGYGRELGSLGIREFTNIKTLSIG